MSKKTIFLLAGIALLLVVLWGGAKYYAHQKVEQFIAQANASGNRLELEEWGVNMGIFSVGLHAKNVTLQQRIGDSQLSGTLQELSMKGLSIRSLLFSEQPIITALSLTQPQLKMTPLPKDTTQRDTTSESSSSARKLPLVGDFNLGDGQFFYQTGADSSQVLQLFGINVAREDFSLAQASEGWHSGRFSVDSMHYPAKEKAAAWRMSKLNYEPDGMLLTFDKIELAPQETAKNFLARQTYDDDWLAVSFDNIRIVPFQIDSLLSSQRSLVIDTLSIGSVSLANYVDPSLPKKPNKTAKMMPVESFRQLGFPVTVHRLNIGYAQITYAMFGEDNEPAELAFTDARIRMRNLATFPIADSLYVDIDATFDQAAQLNAHFAFDQAGNGRTLRIWGEVGEYELVKINPLMITAANAYVESGQMTSMDYNAEIVNETATGDLLIRYQNLDFDLQNAWFKNLVKGAVINDNNPDKNGDLRYGQIYYEHAAERSFFNFYWKAILSGLQSTIAADIVNKKELKAVEVKGERRKKRKK